MHTPGVASIPGTEVSLESADVSVLTSPGLGELKHLINEAANKKVELQRELFEERRSLDRAAARLRRSQAIVIRLFTAKSIPRLVDAANKANDAVDETEGQLDGCFLEIEVAFSSTTQASYSSLVRSFEALRTAQRIWDITSTAAVDRFTQRTTASSALTRVTVPFDFATSDIIRSEHKAIRLGTASGRDFQIHPGFVMMRDAGGDFALIEFGEVRCDFARSNFIEEETPPSDAEQIGVTWKKSNKDGSRDRRFNGNYQIPILCYGALVFSSPAGLREVYQVSSHAKAAEFAQSLANHQRALANLESGNAERLGLPAPSDGSDHDHLDEAQEPAFRASPRKNLAVDWALLAIAGLSLIGGGGWTVQHRNQIAGAFASAPTPPATTPVQIKPPPPPVKQKAHHRGHHRRHPVAVP